MARQLKFWMKNREKLYNPCSKNKGTHQLHDYCTADLQLCFHINAISRISNEIANQRTNGPENAHLKPDPGVLSHHEMTLTLNTHTPLLNS